MVFLLVKPKSENPWISVCPNPKYHFFIEVLIKRPVFLEVNASQLAARRAARARSCCLHGVQESGKSRRAVFLLLGLDEWGDGLCCGFFFWLRTSAVPGCWPQLCPFLPALMSTQLWTSLMTTQLYLNAEEQESAVCLFPSIEKCTEVLRMRLAEVVTAVFNSLPSYINLPLAPSGLERAQSGAFLTALLTGSRQRLST